MSVFVKRFCKNLTKLKNIVTYYRHPNTKDI